MDINGFVQDNDDKDNDKYDCKNVNLNQNRKLSTVNPNVNFLIKRSREISFKIEDLNDQYFSLLDSRKRSESRLNKKDEAHKNGIKKEKSHYDLTFQNGHDKLDSRSIAFINRFADLNQELYNINEDLIKTLESLNWKHEKQQEFISIAAHEIRSPSQAILGYIELLNLEPVNSKKYLKLISRNAKRLDLLVSNILDASKIDNKTLTLKKSKFNLVEFIQQIIEDINIQITNNNNKTKNVLVIFENNLLAHPKRHYKEENSYNKKKDGALFVNADKLKLTQVIYNLLDNSIRFTKEGKIIVRLRQSVLSDSIDNKNNPTNVNSGYSHINDHVHSHKEIIVETMDPGKGINSNIIPRLFSKFASDSTTMEGTGLGLFISKNIVEAHGGKIWAENNKNEKGAKFSFSLPLVTD